jgi:hypothetical protein
VVLLRPSVLDELCGQCGGIGVVKALPEEELAIERQRQRDLEDQERKSDAEKARRQEAADLRGSEARSSRTGAASPPRVEGGGASRNATVDPQAIKLIGVFSIDIRLDEGNPLSAADGAPVGAFIAFGALNKEMAAYLLEHKPLLTGISFVAGKFTSVSDAEAMAKNLLRVPGADVISQTGFVSNFMGQRGALFVFTCVQGTGQEREVTGPIVPKL